MGKLSKLKLNALCKSELQQREMNKLVGGENCCICGCSIDGSASFGGAGMNATGSTNPGGGYGSGSYG